jgi:hypothetical protein
MISPEAQIEGTIATLLATVQLKGWPTSRREDIQALLRHLEEQWRLYQRGELQPFDNTVEI